MRGSGLVRLSAISITLCVFLIAISGGARQGGRTAPTITKMEEASGTTTYDGETSHVERITFTMPGSGGFPPPAGTGSTTSTGTTGTTGTTGGDTGPYYTTISTTYHFYALNSSGFVRLTDDATSTTATETTLTLAPVGGTAFDVYGVAVNPGDACTLRITPASQAVETFYVAVSYKEKYYMHSDGTWFNTSYGYMWGWFKSDYAISRTAATAVAVDSRMAFGQPNIAGALPGDANALASNVNFYNWTFFGGLFAGNADYFYGNDQSGTARLEVQATLPSTTSIVFEQVTLLNLGPALQFTTPASLTGYDVSSGVSLDFTTATWANVWPITGAASSSLTFGTGTGNVPANEYANFEFSSGHSGLICIATTNEASIVTAHTSLWQYFADAAYITALTAANPGSTSSVPFSDPLARIWLADLTATPVWGAWTTAGF